MRIFSLIFAMLMFVPSTFAAGDASSVLKLDQFPDESKTSYITTKIQLTTSNYEYKEPGLMKIGGVMNGLLIGVRARPNADQPGFFFGGNLDYFTGRPTYNGKLANGEPHRTNSNDHFYTLQGIGGYTVRLDSTVLMDFSGGLARRYLNDKGESRSAYEREQTYWYLPFQIQSRVLLRPRHSLTAGLEADVFIKGTNKSHLSDVNPMFPDVEFHQNSGSGYKMFVAWNTFLNAAPVNVELYHRTWNIAESSRTTFQVGEAKYWGVEPKNSTKQTGLAAGVSF